MRNLINLTAAAFLLLSLYSAKMQSANGHKLKYDSLSCLQVEGKILNSEEGVDASCTVEIICQNEVVDAVTLREGKTKFKFVLNKNSFYAIRVSKKGFITKLVAVNTEILTETDGIYKFVFETSLVPEAALKYLNEDVVDFPVAIIQFDYEQECFTYNEEYTNTIREELHKGDPGRRKNRTFPGKLDK